MIFNEEEEQREKKIIAKPQISRHQFYPLLISVLKPETSRINPLLVSHVVL